MGSMILLALAMFGIVAFTAGIRLVISVHMMEDYEARLAHQGRAWCGAILWTLGLCALSMAVLGWLSISDLPFSESDKLWLRVMTYWYVR